MNFINGEAFFIFPDVQIEFPHAFVLSMNIGFFFTGSYYKHLTVSNEVISHKQTIEQTNHPQCQLVLIASIEITILYFILGCTSFCTANI